MDKEKMLYVGYLNSYFGLKGQVKILTETNHLEKVFKVGNTLYIKGEPYEIASFEMHNKLVILGFKGYDDINKINHLLKNEVYTTRKEIGLEKEEYLTVELLGCKVSNGAQVIGRINEVLLGKEVTYIKTDTLIIPLVEKYLDYVDIQSKIIYVKCSEELMI